MLSNTNVPPQLCMNIANRFSNAKMYDDMDKAIKLFIQRAPASLQTKAYRDISVLYAQAQKIPEAADMMRKHLTSSPIDVNAWHELGVMYAHLGNKREAIKALQQAIRIGGNNARSRISAEQQRFVSIANSPEFRKLLRTRAPASPLVRLRTQ